MPLVLHCRDSKAGSTGRAYPQMIEILKGGYAMNGGVVHSYTGSLDEAKEFLNLGLHLGFNGIITFARQYEEVVKYAPLESILLETDSPYLTPLSRRSSSEGGRTRNEPSYVIEVAKKVAELKNVSFDEVAEQTTQNCCNLFKI